MLLIYAGYILKHFHVVVLSDGRHSYIHTFGSNAKSGNFLSKKCSLSFFVQYISAITSFRPACCTTQFVSDCGRNPKDSFLMAHMSRVKRKPFFLHTRNQRCRSALRYPLTQIVQSFFFINPKLQASRHILQLYSPDCVRPGQKPRRPVFLQRGSYCRGHFLQHVASLFHFALVQKIMKK